MGQMKRLAEHWAAIMGVDGVTDSVLAHAHRALHLSDNHLRKPLSIEQIRKQSKANEKDGGGIEGIICMTLNEIIDIMGISVFDDLLSMRLTGTELLQEIQYELICADLVNDILYFRVEGDPSGILECEEGLVPAK